jgi:hypothetical protein
MASRCALELDIEEQELVVRQKHELQIEFARVLEDLDRLMRNE